MIVLGLIVLTRRRALRTTLRPCWPILLFLAYCLLSLVWSDFPDIAFKRLVREAGNLVIILLVWTESQPLEALKRILTRAAYILIPLSILFCRYFPFGRSYGTWTGELTYTGVSQDKNGLAQLCLICGLAAIWQLLTLRGNSLQTGRTRHLLANGAILVMVAYLLALADSVTSRSCMALAIVILLAAQWRIIRKSSVLVHILVVILIVVPVAITIFGASPDALQAMGRNSTLTDRTLIWTWVIKLVPNNWVGAGYGSFWLGHRLDLMVRNVTHTWVPYQAHNGYLDIFANLGWFGVGLLGLVIGYGYLRIVGLWRRHHPAGNLMLAYFIVGMVSNLTEASFFRNMFPIWLVFLLAITMPAHKSEESAEDVKRATRSSRQEFQYELVSVEQC